jgi:hypothetical protein
MGINDRHWELTGQMHPHKGVYYYFWSRANNDGELIYQVTIGANPPSLTIGGFKSPNALILTKFGKRT